MNNLYQLHQIETPRLKIRPVQPGDEYGLHQSILRSVPALRRWMPWARDTSFQAARDFIRRNVACWQTQTSKDFPLTVIYKETNTIISVSGFNEHTDLVRPCFEIGYWIDSTYEGKGLASELVNGLTRYALECMQAIRAQICTQIDNEKSAAVAKRCGYTFEAMLRNICLDCNTKLPSDGLLFSCCDTALLPPLAVTWKQNLAISIKTNTNDSEAENSTQAALENAEKLSAFQTKNISLRAPRMQDAEKLYTALINSFNEISPWFTWAKKDLTLAEVKHHMAHGVKAANDVLAAEYLFFLVWDKHHENILGEVGCKIVDWAVPNVQINYWFDTNLTTHEYAFEAIVALVRFAFAKRNAKCIQLYISEKNINDLNLAKQLGFQSEGILKNYFKNQATGEISSAEVFSMISFSQLKKESGA